jgi:hypothetical protein
MVVKKNPMIAKHGLKKKKGRGACTRATGPCYVGRGYVARAEAMSREQGPSRANRGTLLLPCMPVLLKN